MCIMCKTVNMSFIFSDLAPLFFTGMFRGGIDILVRAKLALADGVTMQLTVRSPDSDIAELITSAVG